MAELYPHQRTAVDRVREIVRAGKRRVLLVAPVGAGKTVMASDIIRGAMAKGSRCMFLAHRKELIDQPSKLLDSLGLDHGVIKGSHWRNRPHLPLQIASVQTLVKRDKPPADIVIIDETHRARAAQYTDILEHYKDAVVIGLTATPWRLDRRGLGEVFDELVLVAKPAELVERGYLIDPAIKVPSIPDMAGSKAVGGDWTAKDAHAAMRRSVLVGDVVAHWRRYADGFPTVGFACTVEHSQEMTAAFNEAGIPAAHIDGTFSEGARDDVLGRLERGEIKVVFNVDLLCEGWDLPMLRACILARPTKSLTAYVQRVGRIMRTAPGKADAIVLDHAGCTLRFGAVTEDREYTLDGDTPKRAGSSLKVCPECMEPVYTILSTCPHCQYEWPEVEVVRDPLRRDGELVDYEKIMHECGACHEQKARMVATAGTFQIKVLCRGCRRTTYVVNKVRAAGASHAERMVEYDRLLEVARSKGFKDGWAAHQYKELFGKWPRRGRKTA